MKINNKSKIIILIIAVVFLALIFGSRIPLLNQLPFYMHEHEYRPVLDEKGKIQYWTCAMHPSVRLEEPGQCPICGMELVPVENEQAVMGNKESMKDGMNMNDMRDHSGHYMGMMSKSADGNGGSPEFYVDLERQQLIGLKTENVAVRPLDKTIRTVGKVELDETKIEHVHSKVSGWIDKVFVDFTWKHVKKGDPLFSIYSPELVSTQQEYLLALKSKDMLSYSKYDDISGGATSLAEVTRRRLELWDISEGQIRELERTGKVKKSLVIYSPITGHVSQKNAFENMYVDPQTIIFTIADHSTAWVNADIYEDEISLVKVGQQATMTIKSLPGERFAGRVTFIWPHLMQKTRTTKARLEFPNPDLKLLPEMFTNVEIKVPSGDGLTVPVSAVLRTGRQDIAFVDKGDGKLEIRKVILGHKAGEYFEVLKGLKEGESVVTSANFLIDSESKIKSAVATWGEDKNEDSNENDSASINPKSEMNKSE